MEEHNREACGLKAHPGVFGFKDLSLGGDMFDRILIAYDGSDEAKKALEAGIQLSAALHSTMTLVSVLEPLPGYVNLAATVAPSLPADLREERRQRLDAMQSDVKRQAGEHSVKVETLLIEGPETTTILDAARLTHADLIVIGLRRHATGIEFAGTVRRIANESPCPILAVPIH